MRVLILAMPEPLVSEFTELFLIGLHLGFDLTEMVGVEFVILDDFISVFRELTLQTVPFFVFAVPLFEPGYFLLIRCDSLGEVGDLGPNLFGIADSLFRLLFFKLKDVFLSARCPVMG